MKKRKLFCAFITSIMLSGFLNVSLLAEEEYSLEGEFTCPIQEYADDSETQVWKFLWVLPLTSTATMSDGSIKQGDTLDDQDVEDFVSYIVPDFEAAVYEYSKHYMKIDSTVVVLDTIPCRTYDEVDYYAESYDVEEALNSEPVRVVMGNLESRDQYDHVAYCFQPENTSDPSLSIPFTCAGLGGGRYEPESGIELPASYSITLVSQGMDLDDEAREWKKNGFEGEEPGFIHNYYYSELVIHEFLHGLQFYWMYVVPESEQREMPDPDGLESYLGESPTGELANGFYKLFFEGAVPIEMDSTFYFGLRPEDYSMQPSKYSDNL